NRRDPRGRGAPVPPDPPPGRRPVECGGTAFESEAVVANDDGLDLGWFEMCLNVADLSRSIEFYRKLGFRTVSENRGAGFAVIVNGDARLALYEGHIDGNLLNFRGGDVFAIAAELKRRGL